MARLIKDQITVFDAEAGATANSSMIDVRDFRNTMITFTAASNYAGTIKAYASYSGTAPDLSSAASASNEYWAVEMKDKNDDGSVVGTTGVVYDGASDGVTGYATNTDGIQWLGFKISGRTAGNVTVKVSACDNQ